MLFCACHSSDSFLFPEIKLMFSDKGLQQQYFPYKRFSERLKGAEKLNDKTMHCVWFIIFILSEEISFRFMIT